MNRNDPLFFGHLVFDVLRMQDEAVKREIGNLSEERVLKTDPEELTNYFAQKLTIDVPILDEDKITVDREEINIDVSGDPNRFFMDDESTDVPGVRFSFFVPYSGDKVLFHCQPSSHTLNPPRARVEDGLIILDFEMASDQVNDQNIRAGFDRELGHIKNALDTMRGDTDEFNKSLPDKIKGLIDGRRDKFIKEQEITSSLGFPLKKRENASKTYYVEVPKKLETMPPMSDDPFKPEPELELKKYEEILNIIKHMVLVIERSPKRFRDLDEEAIRDQFLVQLNGQYEGKATGETFNYNGKTDILIREKGKNLFIAECKFWKGSKQLSEAVDQILGYTSWRDTKTAILLFNKTKDFTEVVAKTKDAIIGHPNFIEQMEYSSETGMRCKLRGKDDKKRELILTIEAFNIPAEGQPVAS